MSVATTLDEKGKAAASRATRTAVVTGGARGLGLAIARALKTSGANVVIAGRDRDALVSAASILSPSGEGVLTVVCDIQDHRALQRLADTALDAFGQIDLLVANSGVAGPTAPLWETDLKSWREAIDVNVVGAFLSARAVLPAMVRRGSGSIVFIGSMTGKRPLYGRTSYAASKAALIGLTRTLAVEAGPHGVRVNLVSPGPVAGDRIERVLAAQASALGTSIDAARAEMLTGAALARFVAPEDVARAVVFLAGEQASGITGEDLNVSAGLVTY
jgi:NAD(P)-dependent dehydrogenase (short-subunit alcohol dehydrogenase family)